MTSRLQVFCVRISRHKY